MTVDIHQNLLRILTSREADVARLLLAGYSNKQAARHLGISPRTVEVHRSRIMDKANARSAMELATAAITGEPGTRHTMLRRLGGPGGRDWLMPC